MTLTILSEEVSSFQTIHFGTNAPSNFTLSHLVPDLSSLNLSAY